MRRSVALALAFAFVVPGCLGGTTAFTWRVAVDPFDRGSWVVDVPVPVGVRTPKELVDGLMGAQGSSDVVLLNATDGQSFLRVIGRTPVTLLVEVESPGDAVVRWEPLRDGVPLARVAEARSEVRVEVSWTIEDGDCRGEAWGLLSAAEPNGTAMRALPRPCGQAAHAG